MRRPVLELLRLGPLPSGATATPEQLRPFRACLDDLAAPLTNNEARALIGLFPRRDDGGDDELAWMLLERIESAPGWPLSEVLGNASGWVGRLRTRAEAAGTL